MIDLTIRQDILERNIHTARENGVIIPTLRQMRHPEEIPGKIQDRLRHVGLWDVDPLNLFRITWKNQPVERGGLFSPVPNYIEIGRAHV